MSLTAGACLGPYEIRELLGAGGMGEVYRAHDPRLGRDVALKVILTEGEPSAERLKRFEDEARAVARLTHPNVLAVFDVGAHDGRPYVVFELLEGETLRQRLRTGPLPLRSAVESAIQVCRGLQAAHARGILHRDLKPENLFLTSDGFVKILDFGLAKLTRGDGAPAPGRRECPDRDGPGCRDGDAGLPLTGAGAGDRGGRAVGHLRAGGGSLRGALGTASLLGGDGSGDDLGDPARGPAAGADRLGAAAAPGGAGRAALSREGAARTASTRRTTWPSRSRRFWTGPPRRRSSETTAGRRARTPASAPSPRRTRAASSGARAKSRRSGSGSGPGGSSR